MYMMEISVTFLLTGCLIQGVFCAFNINLPTGVEALEGSCVFIPCTFDIDDHYKNDLTYRSAKRMWLKDKTTVVFNSNSPDTGLLRGEIFGTLKEKNCTTRFDNLNQRHKGLYYFRIETNKFKYTYINFEVEISIIASPPKPTVSLFKDQEEVTEVMEGSSVNLRCSTKIFCSSRAAVLTWSSSPEHLLNKSVTKQQRQEETHLISDLIFTVTHRHHLATFTCTVTHQLQQQITKSQNQSRTLHVQYAPKNTSAHVNPAGFVLEGRSVTLSCSSDANPQANYTWYRDTEEPLKPVQTGQNLTINNTDLTHSGRYVCTAQNKHGTQNASVLLDVQFMPKISISCNQSSKITCVCEAHGNPSPTLECRLFGNVLDNSISNETSGNTSSKTVLIHYQPLTNTAVLQCFSANTHGTASISQKFHPITPKTETRFHQPSMLLGAAAGTLAMMILYIMKICYERNPKASGTRQDDRSGLTLTQTATASDGDDECVYAVTHKPLESLHYSSIDFTNAEPASGEIRGISSLTDEYAVVRHRSAKDAASVTDPRKDQSPPDSEAKITDVSSEDTIYGNMTRRLVV